MLWRAGLGKRSVERSSHMQDGRCIGRDRRIRESPPTDCNTLLGLITPDREPRRSLVAPLPSSHSLHLHLDPFRTALNFQVVCPHIGTGPKRVNHGWRALSSPISHEENLSARWRVGASTTLWDPTAVGASCWRRR